MAGQKRLHGWLCGGAWLYGKKVCAARDSLFVSEEYKVVPWWCRFVAWTAGIK